MDTDSGSFPLWVARNRERREQPDRPPIDLTECPHRRRPVAQWVLNRFGNDTLFFNRVIDVLMSVLSRRNIDDEQRRAARRGLRCANEISISRFERTGCLISWHWRCQTFFIAIREQDALIGELDSRQHELVHALKSIDKAMGKTA